MWVLHQEYEVKNGRKPLTHLKLTSRILKLMLEVKREWCQWMREINIKGSDSDKRRRASKEFNAIQGQDESFKVHHIKTKKIESNIYSCPKMRKLFGGKLRGKVERGDWRQGKDDSGRILIISARSAWKLILEERDKARGVSNNLVMKCTKVPLERVHLGESGVLLTHTS